MTRLRDLLLYVAVGIGLVAAIVWSSEAGVSSTIFSAWFGGLISLFVSLAYSLNQWKKHLKRIWPWVMVAATLVLHGSLLLVAITDRTWRAAWWGFVGVFEMWLFSYVGGRMDVMSLSKRYATEARTSRPEKPTDKDCDR
jgi:hypothetical protein